MSEKETKSFQAETKKLLDLMIHSIYTHKEVFLRELLSNASDAIDKIRVLSLTDEGVLEKDGDFEIRIHTDKDEKTISISDNGCGMTYDEVVENIGTIAKSGTKEFLDKLSEAGKTGDAELIGKFGVGFYSCFMVASDVTLTTRAYNNKGVSWQSQADGTYTIEECEKTRRGTEIKIKLRDELEEDFTDQNYIRTLVKKYSDYIRYPIKMEVITTEMPKDEEGNVIKDAKPETKKEVQTLNSMTPLWQKSKSDITEEQYADFYKTHFHDWNKPLTVIHTKAEGTLEYTALLFIPERAPFDYNMPGKERGVQLFSEHVFIMDNYKEILPEYLKFVRGLVDSSDLPLNISREFLQNSREISTIGKNIEKKILDTLKDTLEKEREKYEGFWKEFGETLKVGVYTDMAAKDKLQDLLLFESSKDEKYTTLKEYISRMKENQTEIYYATGKDRVSVERLPQMEVLKEKEIEVLYFLDKVDEFMTLALNEYDGKKIVSITRANINPDSSEKEEEKKEVEKAQEENKSLISQIKDILGDKVKDVRLTNRLKKSAVCLVSDDDGLSFNMEQVLAASGAKQMMPSAGKVLEINPTHALFGVLKKEYEKSGESDSLKKYTNLLYQQALLVEGYTLEDPVSFSEDMTSLMIEASK